MRYKTKLGYFNLFKLLFIAIFLLIYQQQQPANANRAKLNYSLLVGEWSNPGKCDRERYIYTSNNKYAWMQKKDRTWEISYQGVYVSEPEQNAVIIGDNPNTGGYFIDIHKLNKKNLEGEWDSQSSEGLNFDNPEDAKINYIRCSGKVFK